MIDDILIKLFVALVKALPEQPGGKATYRRNRVADVMSQLIHDFCHGPHSLGLHELTLESFQGANILNGSYDNILRAASVEEGGNIGEKLSVLSVAQERLTLKPPFFSGEFDYIGQEYLTIVLQKHA